MTCTPSDGMPNCKLVAEEGLAHRAVPCSGPRFSPLRRALRVGALAPTRGSRPDGRSLRQATCFRTKDAVRKVPPRLRAGRVLQGFRPNVFGCGRRNLARRLVEPALSPWSIGVGPASHPGVDLHGSSRSPKRVNSGVLRPVSAVDPRCCHKLIVGVSRHRGSSVLHQDAANRRNLGDPLVSPWQAVSSARDTCQA